MTAVLHAGFAELDGFGSVTQVDALDGEPSQGCGRQFCVACLGCQAEGVGVVALGEPAQFWGVAFVLGHPAGEVDQLGGRGEQLAPGGLGEAAFQPGSDILGQVADCQMARVAAAELGRRVAEGLHHVAHSCHFAPADADGPWGDGRGPASDAVHVGQAEGRQGVSAGGADEVPAVHVVPSQLED